ncbi:MAG: hypothetical protein NUV61_03110 [Candidatus Azambacteria bacterium]|nr:hypothetical protein [Candidatus Azambacteria bacterium]
MGKKYKGTVVEESLEDNRILNELEITGFRISSDEDPQSRWHLYTVKVSEEDILKLSKCISPGKWYMHFWSGRNVIAVFRDKTFEFNYDNKATWKEAVDYGLSVGTPREQLDFLIEE